MPLTISDIWSLIPLDKRKRVNSMIGKRILCGLALLLPVSGCIHVNHNLGDERWFNASLPIHLQHTLYQQERAFCAQAADNWQPVPDIHFSFAGARHINGMSNVSVEGSQSAVTTGPVDSSLVSGVLASDVGFWKTVAASTVRGRRETRDERRCMTALGWSATNDTWNGTPAHLNETIPVNKAVMASVKRGYSHPLLGDGAMALIDMRRSALSAEGLLVHTAEISLFAPEKIHTCVYELAPSESFIPRLYRGVLPTTASNTPLKKGLVRCNGGNARPVTFASSSPLSQWIRDYF